MSQLPNEGPVVGLTIPPEGYAEWLADLKRGRRRIRNLKYVKGLSLSTGAALPLASR